MGRFLTVAFTDRQLKTINVGGFVSHVTSQISRQPIHLFLQPVDTVFNAGQPGHQFHNRPDQIRPDGQQGHIGWDDKVP
jgi:hypothetical protein